MYIGRFIAPGADHCTGTLVAAHGVDGCVLSAGHCFDDWDTPTLQECGTADLVFEMPLSPAGYIGFDVVRAECRRPPSDAEAPNNHSHDVAIVKIDLDGFRVSNLPRMVADPLGADDPADMARLENMVIGEGEGTRATGHIVVWESPWEPEDPFNGLPALWPDRCLGSDTPCWVGVVGEESETGEDWHRVQLGDSGGPWFYRDGPTLNVFAVTTGAMSFGVPDPSGNGWSFLLAASYLENDAWVVERISDLGCR
jgi:hypothetical protein